MIDNYLRSDFKFDAIGITISLPDFTTIFDKGVASGVGWLLSFAFMGLLAIWITFSLIAAYKITRSGMEKELETGVTLIKNVWVSATVGLIFFAVISVIGSFIGVGNITEWNYTLMQCHDASGGFYFMDIAAQELQGLESEGAVIQCCKVEDTSLLSDAHKDAGFLNGTYHYIINPLGGGFSECEPFE
ncbi:MAG TPA: hypothetical protein PKU95_00830 [Candidatus Dojkabacteria bacterium]|nr:hypothetical protein [Candidatus Dojkabacteria bacterium]